MHDTIVIGAGITGILAAKKLNAPIIEKSRNIGGRFASRRFSDYKFNFGTRNFVFTEQIEKEVFDGIRQGTLELKDNLVFAKDSFNDWTKYLAKDISIEVDEVCSISRHEKCWEIRSETQSWRCKKIVVTLPAPQAYKLFEDKRYCSHLANSTYKSQMFLMCSSEEKVEHEKLTLIDCSFQNGFFYSLFEINEHFSEKSREEIRLEWHGKLKLNESFAHKWRYSRVLKPIKYQQTHADLFLLGDYYKKDIYGAISSLEHLT